MKKQFFIPACVLVTAAVGFVLYALGLNCIALCLNAAQKKREVK